MAKKKVKKKPAKKVKKRAKGPPASVLKFIKEFRQGKHQGIKPTPEHAASVWDTSYIPDRCTPATAQLIAQAEKRLGVTIPEAMRKNLRIQNGGCLPDCDPFPFEEVVLWTNATVDGILPVQKWELASRDHWFDSVNDVAKLHLLVRIAAHSEAQLCLDYRKSGKARQPAVTFIDVCMNPTEVVVVAKSVDDFVDALVAARPDDDDE
jgi:hypothetical protein